jgi:hypothetical protein
MAQSAIDPARRGSVVLVALALLAVIACAPAAVTPAPAASGAGPTPTVPPPTATAAPSQSATPAPSATPDVGSSRWVPAGDGALELYDEQTVALPDGSALRIGLRYQEDESADPKVAQLWEPATGTWRDTTTLPKLRTDFAAIALRDGRVLVTGGYHGVDASYSSAYIFDPATEAWTKTGLMAQARTAPAAALLSDGRVLVAGGYFYQPEDEGAAVGTGIVLAAARLPAAGGDDRPGPFDDVDVPPRGRALATAEIWDPATGQWSSTGALRFARPGPATVTLSDGRVLVVSASDHNVHLDEAAFGNAEVFDPARGRFAMAGDLPPIDRARIRELGVTLPEYDGLPGDVGSLVALPDGGALLVGHQVWWKHEADLVRSFRLSGADPSWSDTGDPFAWTGSGAPGSRTPTPSRLGALVARLVDGSVLVAGGAIGGETGWGEGEQPPQTAERYDPVADTWVKMPDLPAVLFDVDGVGLADGTVLLVGGRELHGSGEDRSLDWVGASYRLVPSG